MNSIRIRKYTGADLPAMIAIWNEVVEDGIAFPQEEFEVYQGAGGHLAGETVLIDFTHHVAFTGDIYVNIHGMTREQAAYNQYAPVLMTSVDTDPGLCARERRAILQRLGVGQWQIFGAHGMKKDYQVSTA